MKKQVEIWKQKEEEKLKEILMKFRKKNLVLMFKTPYGLQISHNKDYAKEKEARKTLPSEITTKEKADEAAEKILRTATKYGRKVCPKCSIPMCGDVKIIDDNLVQCWSCMKCLYEERNLEEVK